MRQLQGNLPKACCRTPREVDIADAVHRCFFSVLCFSPCRRKLPFNSCLILMRSKTAGEQRDTLCILRRCDGVFSTAPAVINIAQKLNVFLPKEAGQFFTPTPVAHYIISCLPIKEFIIDKLKNGSSDGINDTSR